MSDLIYATLGRRAIYAHIVDEEGSLTPDMEGFMVEVFVPDDRSADIDRNDVFRREITAVIAAAITEIEG